MGHNDGHATRTRINGEAMKAQPHQRIDAIDFWRGFALISIFVNHLSDNVFAYLTHRNFGFSDAAELFVFLSGISVALAYGRHFLNGDVARSVRGIYKRVVSLYWVQVAVSLIGIAILVAAATYLDDEDFVEDPDRDIVMEQPVGSIIAIFGLAHQFSFFNILPLYIVLLIITPILLVLARIDKRLMLAASVAFYVITRYFSLHLPSWPLEGEWYFNPLAWQLLFVMGLFIGFRVNEPIKFNPALFILCLVGVVASAFIVTDGFSFVPGIWNNVRTVVGHDKNSLGWLRLLHFVALAYVIYHSGITNILRKTLVYAPLSLIGRHSLAVFATGALLLVIGEVMMDVDIPEQVTGFLIAVGGVVVQYWVARFFEARGVARKKLAAATALANTEATEPPKSPVTEPKAAKSPEIKPALSSATRGG
jgi:hypothetical protein